MTRTIDATQLEGNRPQTFWTILRAETLKLWAPGGVPVWIVVAGVLGILSGVGAALLSTVADLRHHRNLLGPQFSDVQLRTPGDC